MIEPTKDEYINDVCDSIDELIKVISEGLAPLERVADNLQELLDFLKERRG